MNIPMTLDEATEILSTLDKNGIVNQWELNTNNPYICTYKDCPATDRITLGGNFSFQELRAIITWYDAK